MTWDKHRITARILLVAMAAAIFVLSGVRGSDLPPGPYATPGHFMSYFILGALAFASIDAPLRRRALWAVAAASAYGVTDELHQLFVPGRCSDPMDWLVDTAGATAAVVLIVAAIRRSNDRPGTAKGDHPTG